MQNSNRFFTVPILASLFLSYVLFPVEAYSQKKTEEQTLAAFPKSVSGIFGNSCVACHSDQSASKAKMFMNLSDWDKFSSKKQIKKSKQICKKVEKGAMPPSGFLEKHPDAAVTSAQKASLVSWSKSLQK